MIGPTVARLLARMHQRKRFTGKVLTLGRQTVGLTTEQAAEVLRDEGLTIAPTVEKSEAAHFDDLTRFGKGTDFISDVAFFKLFGVKDLLAMDVSDYEGAEILHNLNDPVPSSLHGQFDLIVDGGTFDHLFDLRTAFSNVARMLKPGGRVLQWNAASNFTGAAYVSFGPDLFYDYYVINKFAGCEVYIVEVDSLAQPELWSFYRYDGEESCGFFQSNHIQLVVVVAEKGAESSWDRLPVQGHYRDPDVREEYRRGQQRIVPLGAQPLVAASMVQHRRLISQSVQIGDSIGAIAGRAAQLGLAGTIEKAVRRITERTRRGLGIKRRVVRGFTYAGRL